MDDGDMTGLTPDELDKSLKTIFKLAHTVGLPLLFLPLIFHS